MYTLSVAASSPSAQALAASTTTKPAALNNARAAPTTTTTKAALRAARTAPASVKAKRNQVNLKKREF